MRTSIKVTGSNSLTFGMGPRAARQRRKEVEAYLAAQAKKAAK